MSLAKLKAQARPAFLPVRGDRPIEPADTRYGGRPLMRPGEVWPMCGDCDGPMHCLLQFNLRQLPRDRPAGLPAAGLIQIWDCNECMQWEGFKPTKLCRLLPETQMNAAVVSQDGPEPYPEVSIAEWRRVEDYPHNEEDVVSDTLDEDDLESYINESCGLEQYGKDKLFGWPDFVQGIEYETCPECGQHMSFLTQINSEEHLPVCWGDVGVAMAFFCPRHPHVVTFNWACG